MLAESDRAPKLNTVPGRPAATLVAMIAATVCVSASHAIAMTPGLTLAAWLHTLDPFAIWPIRWYGLSYLFGFFLAYLLIRRVVAIGHSTLKVDQVQDLIITLAIGAVVGGRLGYVVFYKPELLTTFTGHLPFWGLLAINEGGMASHGGIIGAVLAAVWFARRNRLSLPHVLDLAAFGTPLGLAFGRIANFINGELYGRACDPSFPLAVKFPQEMLTWPGEKLAALAPALRFLPDDPNAIPGQVTGEQLHRILDAIQSHNPDIIAIVQPLLTPRHPSQLYQSLLEGFLVFVVLLAVWAKPRKPLVLGGWFALSYGIARIIGEFFRLPDAHIAAQEFGHWGITRGQLLSVFLVLAGVVMVVLAQRRDVPAMGGWRRGVE